MSNVPISTILERIRNYFVSGNSALVGTKRKHPATSLNEMVDYLAASATHPGLVELATDAEAQAGTDAVRAVTPAALAAAMTAGAVPDASETVKGKVELATDAETQAVQSAVLAVTPHGLGAALAALSVISFQGVAAAGPCTATGLLAGDVLFAVTGGQAGVVGDQSANFEAIVTVADQIQQVSADNLAANTYLALVYRPVNPA